MKSFRCFIGDGRAHSANERGDSRLQGRSKAAGKKSRIPDVNKTFSNFWDRAFLRKRSERKEQKYRIPCYDLKFSVIDSDFNTVRKVFR
jgi:hypothetical protein